MSSDRANDNSEIERGRREAWREFELGHFDIARAAFERILGKSSDDLEITTALHQIYTEQTRWEDAVLLLSSLVVRNEADWSPREQLPWRAELFDAARHVESGDRLAERAAAMFESAAAGGEDLWPSLLSGERRAALEPLLGDPETGLRVLEQWLYAPKSTGLREEAIGRIEAIGAGFGTKRQTARTAERLLHAAGEREAAYRVEGIRRSHDPNHARRSLDSRETDDASSAKGLDLTIVGGHPALRSLSRRDLLADGAKNIREIPSAWEGARVERSIVATLSGSDLAVLIARQVAHSTSDQVRKVGQRIGVPMEIAQAASVGSIRRAVERYVRAHPLP